MPVTYLDFFGLRQAPFDIAPDPALFYDSRVHQRVLDWIEGGIAARAPILLLTGAAGTGKTALLRVLADRNGRDWTIGFIPVLPSRPDNILVQTRHAFGLPDQGGSPALLSDQIRRFAEASRANGGPTVLIVDDAQALGVESMAALAPLALEGAKGSALTLLLAGRPELRRLLAAPKLRRLRIAESPRVVLTPFSDGDTAGYVAHRLARSGARAPIFDAGAMQVLHFFGLGVPRLINIMADHCLTAAAANGLPRLDAAWVRAVLREATTTGALSDRGGLAGAGVPQPAVQTAPGMSGRQALDAPQHSAALDAAGVLDSGAMPALAVADLTPPPDLALPPDPVQDAPSSAEPRDEPEVWHAAPAGREQPDPPAPGPDAVRALADADPDAAPPVVATPIQTLHPSADPAPLSPPREPARRLGLWLSAAAVALAGGAAFAWLQPWQAPVPVAAGLAPPSSGAVMDQAAVTPAPGQPPLSPAASQSTAPVLQPVAITPEPAAAALMKHALEIETRDPAQAAVAYARAALRGRARAAWYLGQLHETGTGVEQSPGAARLWYAAAGGLPAAQRRLQALSAATAPAGTPAVPVPIFQARLDTGGSEMIWRVPEGVAPVRFRVEAFGPAAEALPVREATVPGLILPIAVSAWRVTAIGADGRESAPSAMVRMIPAED